MKSIVVRLVDLAGSASVLKLRKKEIAVMRTLDGYESFRVENTGEEVVVTQLLPVVSMDKTVLQWAARQPGAFS